MDWKLINELNEVWHSAFWPLYSLLQPIHWFFRGKKWDSDFS